MKLKISRDLVDGCIKLAMILLTIAAIAGCGFAFGEIVGICTRH